jgi:hypothetical protein
MGVSLTQAAINELGAERSSQAINAETALARGVTAQQRGTEIAAMTYFFQATALDPSLLEAANRSQVIAANISSGNIGSDLRNDIKWREDWIAKLTEFEQFMKGFISTTVGSADNPPFELIYSTELKPGPIDYEKDEGRGTTFFTIPINMKANTAWVNSVTRAANEVFSEINKGLNATGRKDTWGLKDWPTKTLTNTDPYTGGRSYDFTIVFELVNENNKVIGRDTANMTRYFHFSRNNNQIVSLCFEDVYDVISFYDVKVNDLTDNLSIRVASINGAAPEAARIQITAVNGNEFKRRQGRTNYLYVKTRRNRDNRDNREFTVISGLNPDFIENLSRSQRDHIRIGNLPVSWHEPFSILRDDLLPEDFAFIYYSNITVGNGAISIGPYLFPRSRSFTNRVSIGANVSFGGNIFGLREFYDKNGKKAGVYTNSNAVWRYNPW